MKPGRNMAKPWTTYLARSSYMLQQGKFVADVVYYYGEDSNITALFCGNRRPNSRRLQLRLRQLGRAHEPLCACRAGAHHAHRHELPRAGARSEQPAHAARRCCARSATW